MTHSACEHLAMFDETIHALVDIVDLIGGPVAFVPPKHDEFAQFLGVEESWILS